MAELVDQVADEAALTGKLTSLVRTLESAAPDERVHLLAAGLVKDFAGHDDHPPAMLQAAVRRIFQLQGNVKIDALADANCG